MNFKKITSGNIDDDYENLIRYNNNINNDYKRVLHNRKSPLYKNNLRNNNNFYSFNKSPEPPNYNQHKNYFYQNNLWQRNMNKYETDIINLDDNININDYLRKNQNMKRTTQRSPMNYNQNQQNNYYNYNNKTNNRNKILKQFDSDDYDDNNLNYQYSNDNINSNWKKKILQINEQNRNYKYYNKINDYNINTSYKKRESSNDNINYNTNQFDYSDNLLSQTVNIKLPGQNYFNNNYNNYNNINNYNQNKNKNINLSNDYYKKPSQDYLNNTNLSDVSIKNQTFQNYYYTNYNNFPHFSLNNESSSSQYDESYELNKTENYTKKLKNKFSDISKFFSVSSRENTSFELNKDDENYNTVTFKRPQKNDEEHYHQNLTIKIKKKEENNKNNKNKQYSNVIMKNKKPVKYVDNTPDGCNISSNTDINNIKEKKISNFKIRPNDKKMNRFNKLSINSDLNYSNNSENYNNLSSTTMFIPPHKMKNFLSLNNNDNNYQNNNISDTQIKYSKNNIDVHTYYPQKDYLSQSRQIKGRSPQNYNSFNRVYNNIPHKNIIENNLPMNNDKSSYESFQNKTQDEIYSKKLKIKKNKKIKEITVDLSPRKKLFNLSNSNGNIDNNNKINNITPNYNYNLYELDSNTFNDNFNFNNINVKPKSKIESCIITFDKPKKNISNSYDKQYKLSSSLENTKFNKLRYVKKKIPNINNNINNYYETPGMKNELNKINNIGNNNSSNKFIYNKNRSAKKIYQKPGIQKLSNSYGNNSPKETEKNNEVIDYCAPSPDYGKREKNLNENIYSDIYNHSPLLVSGNFKVLDNNKKEQISPYAQKYDEFSFKEKITNNINEVNYSNSKPIKVKIINSNDSNPNVINNTNDINKGRNKNVYMKKTKSNNNFNNNIFTSQRIPTFSNIDDIIQKDNMNDNNKIDNNENNIKKQKEVTPFGDVPKNEKITKLTIKSFSSKKKEIKEKAKILYSFSKKYYNIYMRQQKKELMYISKYISKPIKKPILSICFLSKNKYNYIYKLPINAYEYYTKKVLPNYLILPKIDVGYMTKVLIKNKEYIENKLNNIENDKLVNNNINNNEKNLLPSNNNKKTGISGKNKPIKKRIILIRKTKKVNKNFYNNEKKEELERKIQNVEINENDIKNRNNINHINADKIISPTNNEQINKENNNEKKNNENYNQNNAENINKENNNNENDNSDNINLDLYNDNINNNKNKLLDNIYFKKKKINVIKREQLLPDNNRFDNENSYTSDENLSFNLNINKEIGGNSKNNSKNSSKLFLFHKSIDNSTIKSGNTSLNESLNQSSSYLNLIKAPALNFSVIHNLNNSVNNDNDDKSLSILNNTMNIELEKNHNLKKTDLKIRTIIRGIKKQSKFDFLKNYKPTKNLKLSEIVSNSIKTKKEIAKEKKVNVLIKEDLENYISFYNRNKGKKIKYDWSMIEQLMIKIKLDIVDIINGYLISCDDLVSSKKYIVITNEYINNIIHHYKYNYLTSKNFAGIHKKILQLILSFKNIKIYDSIKFEILGKLLNILLKNRLCFVYDLNLFREADEKTKSNIKKVLIYCDYGKTSFSQIHI